MLGLLPRGTFTVLFLGLLAFAGVQYGPVYFNAWQFYDSIRQDVKYAGASRESLEEVREEIELHAEVYDVPLEKDAIQIRSDGPFFVVQVRYAVPIDLRLFQHDLNFDWSFSGERFK